MSGNSLYVDRPWSPVTWRRIYWCTRDNWTGEWYQRHGWCSTELSLWRGARVGIGWRGPRYDMRTSDVRDLLRP